MQVLEQVGNNQVFGPESPGWQPARYLGTYDAGVTYAYGDAVRALVGGDVFHTSQWKLYISLIPNNTGNDPVVDDGSHWHDTIADGHPVVVAGIANPMTDGFLPLIMHLTQNATGGTFGPGFLIQYNAPLAGVQSVIAAQDPKGVLITGTDAHDFTVTDHVEFYGDGGSSPFSYNHLTGGTVNVDVIQHPVRGGFWMPVGSVYYCTDPNALAIYHQRDDHILPENPEIRVARAGNAGIDGGVTVRSVTPNGAPASIVDMAYAAGAQGQAEVLLQAITDVNGVAIDLKTLNGHRTIKLGLPDASGYDLDTDILNTNPADVTPEQIYMALVKLGLAKVGT